MAFDTNLLATKLKRCRNNLELTLNEVSASSGISISKLQDIETGKVEPYGDEILILEIFIKRISSTSLAMINYLHLNKLKNCIE